MVKEEVKEANNSGIGALHDFLGSYDEKHVEEEKSVEVRPTRSFDMTNKISSGIPGFDNLIEGGFKHESNILVMGGPGTGKTILAVQFLMQDIEQYGTVVYLSFEEKKDELYEDMRQFGWNLEEYETRKKFYYISYSPEQIEGLLGEGGGTLDQFMRKIKPTRLVIDSVTSFTLLGGDELTKRKNLLSFLELIKKWKCTTIFTSQHTLAGKAEHETASFIEYEVDGIVLLYFVRKGMLGEGRERRLEVLKMRGTSHEKSAVTFVISDKGIIIK